PKVEYRQRELLPASSGVYLLVSQLGDVLYVGKAQNIKSRWAQHHVIRRVKEPDRLFVFYCLCHPGLIDEVEGYFYGK
ncbi:GIY-YIG nuclease family protein, partial [Escherichia coli]|uniref:GIY-YIG nuclease family protein n=1 Tax=Escherichia coli TaxID=562 RepID=UPI00193321F3|nr:GIY-YIG nuclease family protein [Escherichia coli]